MKHIGPPRPWFTVPAGTVVLVGCDPAPRTVLVNEPVFPAYPHDSRVVLLEGLPSGPTVGGLDMVQVVELDETDAMLTMLSAGLTVEYLKETS